MAAGRRVAALIAAAAVGLLAVSGAGAGFGYCPDCPGPSVRVVEVGGADGQEHTIVEIRWIAYPWAAGDGKVELFDNPNGTGTPIRTAVTVSPALDHTLSFEVNIGFPPDTTYYFKVTHHDPGGGLPDLTNFPPLPSFFTGRQQIGAVVVEPGLDSARISWDANVIGLGRVGYGTASPDEQAVGDALNVTGHSIELTGLSPGTTYQFRVSNRHAIDGGTLAEQTGSFTTLSTFTGRFLQPLTESTDPAHPVLNTGKNGRVIPVKVQISQGGTAVTDLNAPGPVTITVSKLACGNSAGTDPVTAYADAGQSSAGTNQFRYDALAQAWLYNLDTKSLGLVTGNCYRLDASINGTQITNAFAVFQPTK